MAQMTSCLVPIVVSTNLGGVFVFVINRVLSSKSPLAVYGLQCHARAHS